VPAGGVRQRFRLPFLRDRHERIRRAEIDADGALAPRGSAGFALSGFGD
jgi:hypothetical protein